MTIAPPHSMLNALTPAERLVAVHVAQGMSNKEIAALLGKAEPTVKHQVSSILRSANVQSRCQFIAFYYQQFFCPLVVTRDSRSSVDVPPVSKKFCA